MALTYIRCTDCSYKDVKAQRTYTIKQGEQRTIYACDSCGGTFSSTSLPDTFLVQDSRHNRL
jgi:DNA-directed RNA polymerase subunit RPC12/RpoP